MTAISDFFWIARAGFHAVTSLRPDHARAPKDFLPNDIAAHLNKSLDDLDAQASNQNRLLRYLCLVYAVTEYEEYLGTIVRDELRRRPLPKKTAKLTVSLDSLPPNENAAQFVHRMWAEARAKEVVGEGYEKRPSAIDSALDIDVVKIGSEHSLDLERLTAACVIRNCVVHGAGRVDRRTLEAVGDLLSGLVLGAPIDFDDSFLFSMIEAMWHHAQDIDLLVRERR